MRGTRHIASFWWVAGLLALSVAGCGASSTTGSDAELDMDGGADGRAPLDAAPEACSTPGALETVPCGLCGTVERFCTAGGTWAYGECTGEAGACEPGTLGSIACGNCGTQPARCTTSCTWEATDTCGGEGECAPGASTRSGAGCEPGETREVTCGDACVYEPTTACVDDACPTPGALDTVPCGMCGTIDRFCSAARVWEYGTCGGEGSCRPGATSTTSCGMCGTQETLCDALCTWVARGACMTEGACVPGTTTRTGAGCPAGETRVVRCDDACGYSTEVEPCSGFIPVDVILLLDTTGSNTDSLLTDLPFIEARCVGPLLALTGVHVGVAYAGEYPIPPYGGDPDRPFEGGIEPGVSAGTISTELGARPNFGGGDGQDSVVEALSVLSGGPVPPSALAMICSSGRVAGGCWRPTAERVIVVHTDSPIHNGPDPYSSELLVPYVGITPPPAEWPDVRGRMTSTDTRLFWLDVEENPAVSDQLDEMLTDLGQPLSDRHTARSGGEVGAACDDIVARVRTIAGL